METSSLQSGEIRIEAYELAALSKAEERLCRYLSPDENERLAKVLHPDERKKYILARGLLRARLGNFLGLDPREIVFGYGTYGKPYVVGHEALYFNLSHSGEWVVLALALDREIGIDIERIRVGDESFDLERALDRVCAQEEIDEFMSLPESERLESFYGGWTRKEALAKGLGLGLQITRYPSARVSFHPQRSDIAVTPPFERRRWTVKDIEIERGYRSAIAFGRGPHSDEPQVRVYRMAF